MMRRIKRKRALRWPLWISPLAVAGRFRIGVPHALCTLFGIVLVSMLVGRSPARAVPEESSPFYNLALFSQVLAHIELSWVGRVDQDALIEGAIRGMVSALDPHSSYLSAEEYRLLSSDTEGQFAGVGIEISVTDGWIEVLAVLPETPAQRAGVKPGDRFLSIAGQPARDLRLSEAVRRMRGPPGTTVDVTLRREGEENAVALTLTRGLVEVEPVAARALPGGLAYLRVHTFQRGTAQAARGAMDALVAAAGEVRGLLLDLRDNPGGLVDEAVSLADEFLESGVIVTTRGRRETEVLFRADAHRSGTRPPFPIVVLVNGRSASAAEILAGALQDHRRAVLVGARTYGKGSVQNVIELPGGSALKLTVARYYTPSGRLLQARGLDPDVALAEPSAAGPLRAVVAGEALLPGHLDPVPPADRGGAGRRSPRSAGEAAADRDEAPFPNDPNARTAFELLRTLAQHS